MRLSHLPLVVAQSGWWSGVGREMRAGTRGDRGMAWRQVLGLAENIFYLEVQSLLPPRPLSA